MFARTLVRIALFAAICIVGMPGPSALAQEAIEVAPNSVTAVKRGLAAPVTGKAEHGRVVIDTQDTRATLLYMAPADTKDDTIEYQVNGVAQPAIKVSVRAAAPTLTSGNLYEASFKALFVLFIVAVLVESGLALLFRWRPFLDYFDSRSVNAVVAFAFSLLLVRLFNLDITTSLINIYSTTQYPVNWPGMLLTAMVIAGGSAGVNRLFQQLGFRPVGPGTPPPPSLDETQAWVAVSILRDKAVGSVDVQLNSEVAGTISGSSPKGRFLRYFVRDKGRHPQTGGRTVKAGETYEIVVVGYDAAGNAVTPQPPKWGPHKIAPRAIVDVEFKV